MKGLQRAASSARHRVHHRDRPAGAEGDPYALEKLFDLGRSLEVTDVRQHRHVELADGERERAPVARERPEASVQPISFAVCPV